MTLFCNLFSERPSYNQPSLSRWHRRLFKGLLWRVYQQTTTPTTTTMCMRITVDHKFTNKRL